MRRIVIWAMSTLSVLVLLFSYDTSRSSTPVVATAETRRASASSQTSEGSAGGTAPSSSGSSGSSGSTGSASSSSSSGSSKSSGSSATQTFTGNAVMTSWGAVQVEITVSKGRITAADVVQAPSQNRHDQMINSRAVPIYNSEAVDTQSSNIDVVSGATVTWSGYTDSLQSAIDQANL